MVSRQRFGRSLRLCNTLLTIVALVTAVGGLRDVQVTVPVAVTPGDTVTLRCSYNLEGHPLYTVKWYKGRQEFFRYVPKELPHTSVFPVDGVKVDLHKSGANEVVLRDVKFSLSGKYRCEVSADAPTFDTAMVASHMHVVYLPDGNPQIELEKHRYSAADVLKANCTAPAANPAANLTWLVNGERVEANESFRTQVPTVLPSAVSITSSSSPTTLTAHLGYTSSPPEHIRHLSTITLIHEIGPASFVGGKLRLRCLAVVYKLYREDAELVLEEERPRLASVLGTRESSLGPVSAASNAWDIRMQSWSQVVFQAIGLFIRIGIWIR